MPTKEWLQKTKYALFLILKQEHDREDNEKLNISFNYEQINQIQTNEKIELQSEINHFLRFNCSKKDKEFYNEIVENWFIGQLIKRKTVTGKQLLYLLHRMKLYN